jgi:hypothetical protein
MMIDLFGDALFLAHKGIRWNVKKAGFVPQVTVVFCGATKGWTLMAADLTVAVAD